MLSVTAKLTELRMLLDAEVEDDEEPEYSYGNPKRPVHVTRPTIRKGPYTLSECAIRQEQIKQAHYALPP
jgi:hypothetical protein